MVDECWDSVQHLEEEAQLAEAREEGVTLEKAQARGSGSS